jgi:hypothetical protein
MLTTYGYVATKRHYGIHSSGQAAKTKSYESDNRKLGFTFPIDAALIRSSGPIKTASTLLGLFPV